MPASTDDLVADYVRATMRVEPPASFVAEVMRSAAATTQERRGWLRLFGPYTPAMVAVAAAALILAIGTLISAPRNVGPPTDPSGEPSASPRPTITPEDARILTASGDVIRIPALDDEGQFGTITIERGAEKAGYEGFTPIAFEDVFFVELYVTYEPSRATDEEYGEWEFAFAVDRDGNGFDGDELQRGIGFLGMEGAPGFESAPQPQLQGKRFGDEVLEGWLVLEIPASVADEDLYLVYGHGEWTDGIGNMVPDASALLREPGDPVGVTEFDPEAAPPGGGETIVEPSFYALPSPPPSPSATLVPAPDAEADALFAEPETCTNTVIGAIISYPSGWYTNEAYREMPACEVFGPEPIDAEDAYEVRSPEQVVMFRQDEWFGGVELPTYERLWVGDRVLWRMQYSGNPITDGWHYLLELEGDPYGPFIRTAARADRVAIVERMLTLVEVLEPPE